MNILGILSIIIISLGIQSNDVLIVQADVKADQSNDEIEYTQGVFHISLEDSLVTVDDYTWRLRRELANEKQVDDEYGERYYVYWECFSENDSKLRVIRVVFPKNTPTAIQFIHDKSYITYVINNTSSVYLAHYFKAHAQVSNY